jgi:hypothetical protein
MLYTTKESHSAANITFMEILYDTLLSDFPHTTLQGTQNLYMRVRDQIFYVEHNDNSGYNEAVEMCHLKRVAGVQLQDLNRSGDAINRFTY